MTVPFKVPALWSTLNMRARCRESLLSFSLILTWSRGFLGEQSDYMVC